MKGAPLPRPRPCIITALELLGLDDPAMPAGRARQVLALIERHFGSPDLAKLYESHLSLVGHRVLHVAPIKRGGMLPFWSALNLVHLQSVLVSHGVLVRGAVALGDAVAHGDLVFGPGISATENLRNELALVPRVIVDPRLLREIEQDADLRSTSHTAMDELGYLRRLLRQDADGIWFIDYLRALASEVSESYMYVEFLGVHRKLVVQRLAAATRLDGSSHPFTWLWGYHNMVVGELKADWQGDDQELAELAGLPIPATSPLLYTFPPSAKAPDLS